MAINAYTGLMGSGKSYEVTGTVIVKAVSEGRRVVTNIEGIQPDKIRDYVKKKFKLNDEQVGQVICVTDDDVKRASFFPTDDPERYSVVKGGDLVAIDEAWKFWSSGSQLLPEHMEFFRKHRHYVDPKTNVTCDLVLMIQDITDLNKSLKNVIEMTFKTVKLKSLGLSKQYRVEFYEGTRLMKKNQIGLRVNKYDKEIFPLYQSYAGGKGSEKTVDDRQNLFKNKTLWFIVGGLLVTSVFAFNNLYRFFKPKPDVKDTVVKTEQAKSALPVSSQPQVSVPPPVQPSDYKIIGTFDFGPSNYVVLKKSDGSIRVEHPSGFSQEGIAMNGKVDGQNVFRYTTLVNTNTGENNVKN